MPKVTIGITGLNENLGLWNSNGGTLYLDMFCVMGAIQLITWVPTHQRAARGGPTTTYVNKLLRDSVLENVGDLESCMRDRSFMWSQFLSRRGLLSEGRK